VSAASQNQGQLKTGEDRVAMCSEAPAIKDATVVPSEVDSAPPNKAPGRRRKGLAREPRSRSNSATATSERRARLGLKQAEDIKKLERSARPTTIVEQLGADSLRAEVTTASVCEAEKNPESHVSSDISIQVGSHVSGASITEERTATMMSQTPPVAKSEERKLPGDLQGIIYYSQTAVLVSDDKSSTFYAFT